MKKMKKMKKFLYSMEQLFHFLHFFHCFPRLNRKTRFSRSEILKNLNICPSKDRHLTCYTCYRFYDFLQYGLMDLVKSFFKWCMIYNFNRKSQKEPVSCDFIPEICFQWDLQIPLQLLSDTNVWGLVCDNCAINCTLELIWWSIRH